MNGLIGTLFIVAILWLLMSGGGRRANTGGVGAFEPGGRSSGKLATPTRTRGRGPAYGWMLRQVEHEAAHAGIAHGCGVPKHRIWVTLDPNGCYTGPGPGSWGLHGAQRIAFYLADNDRIKDEFGRDADNIRAELDRLGETEHGPTMRRARSIARRYRYSSFARTVATEIRQTRRYNHA